MRNIKKLEKGLSLEQKEGAGRPPPLLTPNDRQSLIKLATKRDTASAPDLQIEMVKRGSQPDANRTIRRYLKNSGFYSVV